MPFNVVVVVFRATKASRSMMHLYPQVIRTRIPTNNPPTSFNQLFHELKQKADVNRS